MNDALITIALNVISAFIFSGMVWLWRTRGKKPAARVEDAPRHERVPEQQSKSDRRAINRSVAIEATHTFLFYLVTFSALYLSISLPPLLKALLSDGGVYLSQARSIGPYLPDIPVEKKYLQFIFLIASAVLYIPMLWFAEVLTSMTKPIVDYFQKVTFRIWKIISMLWFLLLCIPLSATSVWCFYDKSYEDSVIVVLVVMALIFVVAQGQERSR